MASKLGRLRQWAGEVISSRDSKTEVNEEFKDLEKDIELRKEGIQRLILASEGYHHALSKKKHCDVLDEPEKMLPVDTLGIVMIAHGEEFREDSTFGNALVKLGRAHCKIATLQEAYALTFKDTFLTSMERFRGEIKEYESLKKKVETTRVACDSATAKFEKLQTSKKEKDKREAEDEMNRSRQRYEETAEDLLAHMHAIQENEHGQLRELTTFLDFEMNFVQSYLDVLKDVKADWQEPSDSKRSGQSNGEGPLRSFRPPSKAGVRSSTQRSRANSSATATFDSSEDEFARPSAIKQGRSGSNGSKTSSRPPSRLSRMRTNSTAAPSSTTGHEEKEKDVGDRSRRMSVAGWASSAVESVTGSKGKKSKDKDSFANLDDALPKPAANRQVEEGGVPKQSSGFRSLGRRSSRKSKEYLPTNSPSTSAKILKPPSLQDKKVVRALYDFSGSSDELSFKAGNNIFVLHEVLDDWSMGELDGQRGLFPTSYTEAVDSKPSVPARPTKNGNYNIAVPMVIHTRDDSDQDPYLTSDADDEQILRATPMAVNRSPVFYGGFNDSASFTDSMADNDEVEKTRLVPFPDEGVDFFSDKQQPQQQQQHQYATPLPPSRRAILRSLDSASQPLINRSVSENPETTTPTKRIPPPPPPRRTMSHTPSMSPPIPERKAPAFLFSSQPALLNANVTPPSSVSSHGHSQSSQGYDRSPFESSVELEGVDAARCEHFRQNPFKPLGMCSNCLEFHD